LGKRNNNPAIGYWFVPGSRVYKGENLDVAVKRVMANELGVDYDSHPRLLGVYNHRYATNFDNEQYGTEYIVFAYVIDIDNSDLVITADDQHSAFIWYTPEEILTDSTVHVNNKKYFEQQPDNLILKASAI